jgi:hypothetical protein
VHLHRIVLRRRRSAVDVSADPWSGQGKAELGPDLGRPGDVGYLANRENLVVFSAGGAPRTAPDHVKGSRVLDDGYDDWSNVTLDHGVIWWSSDFGAALRAFSARCLAKTSFAGLFALVVIAAGAATAIRRRYR